MLFSYSVIYRAIASEPLFGQFLTAGCSEIDPSPYRCVRCLLEDLCTTMVDTIERSTPKSKADRSNIIETRYESQPLKDSGPSCIELPFVSNTSCVPFLIKVNPLSNSGDD